MEVVCYEPGVAAVQDAVELKVVLNKLWMATKSLKSKLEDGNSKSQKKRMVLLEGSFHLNWLPKRTCMMMSWVNA